MQLLKSIVTVTALTAVIASTTAIAEPLLAPRFAAAKHASVSGAKDPDYVHQATVVGNAAKSKVVPAVAGAPASDPNLLGCARIGKATCNMNPCDGKMVAACCKK